MISPLTTHWKHLISDPGRYPAVPNAVQPYKMYRFFPIDENGLLWAPRTDKECNELLTTHGPGCTYSDGEPMTGVVGIAAQCVTYGELIFTDA